MRAVVQRVTQASVTVDGELLGRIGKGFLILLGVADGDTRQMAEKMADKICRLRIFEDENGKTNLSLEDVEGELLVVSQFTPVSYTHLKIPCIQLMKETGYIIHISGMMHYFFGA